MTTNTRQSTSNRRRLLAHVCLATACLTLACQMPNKAMTPQPAPDSDREHEDGDKPTGAAQAAAMRFQDRLDRDGEIKTGALYRAKKQSDAMPVLDVPPPSPLDDAGIWDWEWLGPGNIGGRVRGFCFRDATTIFLGGVGGGIWRSNDSGGSWAPVNDFLSSLAVTSIVVDPTNSTILYAATGEGFSVNGALPGAGVFRSINGGNSWTQLTATADWEFTNRLAHHPTQTGVLLAATNHGLEKSIDGGDSWDEVLNENTKDVKFDPSDGDHVMAGTMTSVWYSLAAGDNGTWSNQSDGGFGKLPADSGRCEVTFGMNGVLWVSVDRNNGEIWNSIDNSVSWSVQNSGSGYLSTIGRHCNMIWASPDDPELVVVGGVEIWRSTDGGQTLVKISDQGEYRSGLSAHADNHLAVAPPNYGAGFRRLFFANDGGIQRVANIYNVGQTSGWTNLANNLGITQFYAGGAHPSGSHILGGTQDNGVLRYRPGDGAQAWFSAVRGDGGWSAVNYDDAAIQYSETQWLSIRKSIDSGDTWSGAINGLTDAGNSNRVRFIPPFAMDPNDPDVLVAGAANIWRTTDAAGDWDSIRGDISGNPLPKCTELDIADGDSNNIWVGYTNGRVSRTNGDVETWVNVDQNGPLPDRGITDIAINHANHDQVFVTVGGYETDTVWYTGDNGTSWELRVGSGDHRLPEVQVNTVTFHPVNTNWVYVGTDLGVYASEDRGQSWSRTPRYGDHEGPVNTEVSDLFWQSDFLIAATHGRGMYRARPLDIVYVDLANAGFEDGTQANPYDTVLEGINGAGNGTMISIESATYDEAPITFFKRGRVVATGGVVRIE